MRPKTIAEIALQILDGRKFSHANKEFIDEYRRFSIDGKPTAQMYEAEPVLLEDIIENVFLAGLAEYIALRDGKPIPEWTEKPCRYLEKPVIFGGENPDHTCWKTTDPPFAKRNLFIGEIDPGNRWGYIR